MADEDKTEETENTTPPEAAAEEPTAEETPAPEAPAEEPAVEETPAPEAPAEEPAVEADEPQGPKAIRRHGRQRRQGAKPATPEERKELRARKAAQRRRRRTKEREKAKAVPKTEPIGARERPAGRRKVRQGIVVSDKASKTITVRIDVARRHRRYEKIVRSSTTLHAHDETNDAHTGDTVRIEESRPLSATKRWKLLEVTERAR